MTTVNVHEAKTHLSRLLELVEAGETVTIARAGRPIADLVPRRRAQVEFGRLKGQVQWDPDTFDDDDEQIISAFEGARCCSTRMSCSGSSAATPASVA